MKYFLFLILFISCSFSNELEKVKLQLQWKHQFQFAGFYAAKEKGFYKDVGLDVEFLEFEKGMDITEEVLSGNANYGLSFSSIILDYFKNKPVYIFANFFKRSPLLLSPKDIKLFLNPKSEKLNRLFEEAYKIDIARSKTISSNFYDLNLFTSQKEIEEKSNRVENFKNASIRGWQYALKNKEELINIILKKYNTQNKTKAELSEESKQIESYILPYIYKIGSINIEQIAVIANNFSISQSFNKRNLENFIFNRKKIVFDLTSEQKEYLKSKKEIKMCVNPNNMPLSKIDDNHYLGISSDYMKIISKKLNIPFKLIPTTSWTESLSKIRKRECDILSMAQETPDRKKYLNFTKPYLETPLVIATKKRDTFIDNIEEIEDIKDKKIGILRNYFVDELLKVQYPNINFVLIPSIEDGLSRVRQEKLSGLIDNAIIINHEIKKNNFKDISITGEFQKSINFSIASRNDEGILNEILEKTLNTIDPDTRENIHFKWINLKYNTIIDYKLIFEFAFLFIAILLLILYWNLKLKEEIKKRKEVEIELINNKHKFIELFNSAPVFLNSFDENGKITLWNDECRKIFGWEIQELEKHSNPLELFYPEKEVLEDLKKNFINNENENFKEWYPLTKSGQKIITRWANVKLKTGEIINIGYDITKQRTYELELEEKNIELKIAHANYELLNNQLENKIKKEIEKSTKHQITIMEQSKLAQMGEMIDNIAHQWRQPLAEINSTILLLDEELTKRDLLDENLEEKLSEIENITHYMSGTIDDFKNFFDTNKRKEIFNIYDNVIKTLNIMNKRTSYYRIKVDLNINEESKVFGNANELNQVLLIILNNSIDAFIEKNVSKPLLNISLEENEDSVILYIRDNALGIDEKIISKIFDPYFTTKHKTQGTGLGLYISKMIIEKGLNGKISMFNEKDGVCVIIEIPQGIK